jgi:hypothetical protein
VPSDTGGITVRIVVNVCDCGAMIGSATSPGPIARESHSAACSTITGRIPAREWGRRPERLLHVNEGQLVAFDSRDLEYRLWSYYVFQYYLQNIADAEGDL